MSEQYDNFITVNFKDQTKDYYFGVNNMQIGYGDHLVVRTSFGLELVEAVSNVIPISELPSDLKLKPILRIAKHYDLNNYQESLELAEKALSLVIKYIEKLGLNMNPISAKYTLDLSHVLIIYVAEERVDFRELLKLLNANLKVRIELRQIGERDKAKMISGIATCGMQTCCSRFMNNFDMISINMAKNQNLALNISKLSGLCGKFMCCLKHEDQMYKDVKKQWPEVNSKIVYKGQEYYINSMNYIAEEAKLVNKEETIYVSFKEAFSGDYHEKG